MDRSLSDLLIAVVFFLLGAAVIGLIWYFRMVMKKGKPEPKKSDAASEDQTEIARLIRDNKSQDLVVEMEGNSYKTFQEITPVLQRRLSFTSNVLAKWIAAPAPEPASEAEAPIAAAESNSPGLLSGVDTLKTSEVHPEWVPPFADEPVPEVKPVSTNIPDVVGGLLKPASQPTPQFKSIAMQINDILQAQLAGTALESRGITVNDAPDHGVMVTLDGEKYPGLKDVPDEEVRKAIRAAVLEWETRK